MPNYFHPFCLLLSGSSSLGLLLAAAAAKMGEFRASSDNLADPFALHDIHNMMELKEIKSRRSPRSLGSNDYFESLLVDKNGDEYDPDSLAWRYLGMYMDCDVDQQGGDEQNGDKRRQLSGDDGDYCERTILWAAYVDPRYKGGTIGEYQFYDLSTREYDDSTCMTKRCARMDCHEPGTHFKLVGVFKETDGWYDFAEQLLKHEGYCVWNDEDGYETMEEWLEKFPISCNQLQYPDDDGNTLYINTQPLAEGNITVGIFTDEKCSQTSTSMTLYDYIVLFYYNYYGSDEKGIEVAEMYEEAIETWNDKMSSFKICQPCRAYDLFGSSNGGNDHRRERRYLGGDENDGEGDEEQWGYNCYDDAGYTNVNQCYKFETKTSLEVADAQDLEMASNQGTILRIRANGKVYGSGGYTSPMKFLKVVAIVGYVLAAATILGLFAFHGYRKRSRQVNVIPLIEKFDVTTDDAKDIRNESNSEEGDKEADANKDNAECTKSKESNDGDYSRNMLKDEGIETTLSGSPDVTQYEGENQDLRSVDAVYTTDGKEENPTEDGESKK